jgi:hypothetical protein
MNSSVVSAGFLEPEPEFCILLISSESQTIQNTITKFGGSCSDFDQIPLHAELLDVDGLVSFDNLGLELLDFGFVHLLNFVISLSIGLFEVLELVLELLELSGDSLVLLGELFILLLRLGVDLENYTKLWLCTAA